MARFFLLVRSLKPLAGHRDLRRYRLGGKELPPRGDAYLRHVYSSSVPLRNIAVPVS